MNQKGIAPLVIVAVIAVIAVVAGVGVYAATRGGGGGNGGGGNGGGTDISGASSLQFDVNSTTENLSSAFTFYTKNIGTSNVMIRIDGTVSGEDVIYIINGAQQKVWIYAAGTWIDLSSSYSTYWETWSQSLQGYQSDLVDWSNGSWTSPDGSTTISNIQVNPSLSDSLFEH
jgi:hypothetical protein